MKRVFSVIAIAIIALLVPVWAGEWIRVNQLGYLPGSPKVAVYMSDEENAITEFSLF